MPRVAAILAAAGRGARFGAPENKVFAPLAGRTVLYWSLRALDRSPSVDEILIAASPDDHARIGEVVAALGSAKVIGLCAGGAERQDTVWNALQALPDGSDLVAIHDGARPLATPALIEAVICAAAEHGAALPATAVVDTLKRSADGSATRETVPRAGLYGVQTPQVFRRDWLLEAYASARGTDFAGTDDASYVERLGHPVQLVPGHRENLKITLPADLDHAERLMRASTPSRTGFGYDVHPLATGRNLVLGGVPLEFERGLDGHSDADVLLHAICDALLGAACLGDIGLHFPNTNPRFKDISSVTLLEHVGKLLGEQGFAIEHVDCMLLAEAPKIRPHVDRMRANIAGALGVHVGSVNVKATTSERLGFVGREEGMAAYAVATVRGGRD